VADRNEAALAMQGIRVPLSTVSARKLLESVQQGQAKAEEDSQGQGKVKQEPFVKTEPRDFQILDEISQKETSSGAMAHIKTEPSQ
jgi:hypothetical protein